MERCLAGFSKASQASFCFPVGWRDATGSGRQQALTGGSLESDGPASDSGKQLKLRGGFVSDPGLLRSCYDGGT